MAAALSMAFAGYAGAQTILPFHPPDNLGKPTYTPCNQSPEYSGESVARAWGNNDYGQLGNGTSGLGTSSSVPVQVSNLSGIHTVAAGERHNLALTEVCTVFAWGDNQHGQLGNGTTGGSRNTPGLVISNLVGVNAIAGGDRHSLALKQDGTVWAWGKNSNGQLGNGTNNSSNVSVQVQKLSGVKAIAAGDDHNLALKQDGTLWAWGRNTHGQLGDGTDADSNVPVQVSNRSEVKAIAAGQDHTLALKTDGTVEAWGLSNYGQLGDGTNNSSNVPVQVSNLSGVTAIAAGEFYSLALKEDGTVRTWGDGGYGQLGDGTNNSSNVPVQVRGEPPTNSTGFLPWDNLSGVNAIAAGSNHSLALKEDGTVRAWGENFDGQLGDGTDGQGADSNVPVQVQKLSGVKAIAGGSGHTLVKVVEPMLAQW